jgi:hypothetical protein
MPLAALIPGDRPISSDGRRGTPKIWDGSQWVYYSDLGAFDIDEQLEAN